MLIIMVQLGSYYLSLDSEKLVDGEYPRKIAQKWFEKAALSGNATGIDFICATRSAIVSLKEYETGPMNKELVSLKRDLNRWFMRGDKLYNAKAPGYEKIKYDEFKDHMEQARYSLAYSLYFMQEKDEAYSLVFGKDDTPSCILEALISNERAIQKAIIHNAGDQETQKIIDTLGRMELAIDDNAYRYATKTVGEEYVYATTALQISTNHTNLFGEIQEAYSALSYVLPSLQTKPARELIENELSHYSFDPSGNVYYRE